MGSGYSTQTSLDQGHRGSKRMSYRPRASGASMVHSSGEVPPLFPTPLDPPHRSHFILGIFHLKYLFRLPHRPVAALNGASFSSYGMSWHKGSSLIPGAGRKLGQDGAQTASCSTCLPSYGHIQPILVQEVHTKFKGSPSFSQGRHPFGEKHKSEFQIRLAGNEEY